MLIPLTGWHGSSLSGLKSTSRTTCHRWEKSSCSERKQAWWTPVSMVRAGGEKEVQRATVEVVCACVYLGMGCSSCDPIPIHPSTKCSLWYIKASLHIYVQLPPKTFLGMSQEAYVLVTYLCVLSERASSSHCWITACLSLSWCPRWSWWNGFRALST